MSTSYRCNTCGELHEGLPFTWGSEAPAPYYDIPEDEREERVAISSDQCIIDDEQFYILGRIEIPVLESDNCFYWLAWISLSEEDFERASALWETRGRENEPPYSGELKSKLPCYSTPTVNLAAKLHTQPIGDRPRVELEPTEHPLFIEQRNGITIRRVQEIAEECMHN